MSQDIVKEMNKQIQLELDSGYFYLALSIKMEEANFKGYAKWLERHYKEEFDHAGQFISYMQKRKMPVVLGDVKVMDADGVETPLDVAKLVYNHERKVTQSIYNLHDAAKKADDYATEIFMHSFIMEQIEEEEVTSDIVDKLTFADGDISALYTVDRELATL